MGKFIFGLLAVTSMAIAGPGSYKIEGGKNRAVKGDSSTYTGKLEIKEIKKGEIYEVSETYFMGPKKTPVGPFKTTRIHGEDGSLIIKKNGVVIGCGYCFEQENGNKWCDWKQQTDNGPLHVNAYYDKATETIHRVGDYIDGKSGTINAWTDRVVKQ